MIHVVDLTLTILELLPVLWENQLHLRLLRGGLLQVGNGSRLLKLGKLINDRSLVNLLRLFHNRSRLHKILVRCSDERNSLLLEVSLFAFIITVV